MTTCMSGLTPQTQSLRSMNSSLDMDEDSKAYSVCAHPSALPGNSQDVTALISEAQAMEWSETNTCAVGRYHWLETTSLSRTEGSS